MPFSHMLRTAQSINVSVRHVVGCSLPLTDHSQEDDPHIHCAGSANVSPKI